MNLPSPLPRLIRDPQVQLARHELREFMTKDSTHMIRDPRNTVVDPDCWWIFSTKNWNKISFDSEHLILKTTH